LSLSLAADPETQENNRPDTTSQGLLGIYQKFTGQGGYNAIFSWGIFPSPNFDFRLDAGIKSQYTNTGPMGWFGRINRRYCDLFSEQNCEYIKDRPTHVNNEDGSTWYNADTDVSINNRISIQIDPKISWRGQFFGEHSAKLGLQLKFLRNRATLHQTGNLKYLDQGGGPGEQGLCDPDAGKYAGCYQRNSSADRSFRNLGYSPAIFFQDYWRPVSWLTVTPGIRFDYGQTRLTDGSIFNSQFAVGPRIGLIADITRDQKTILSTSYGRSNEVSALGMAAAYDGTTQGAKVQEAWIPQGSPQGRWVFVSQVGGAGGGSIDKNAKVPHADQITSSLRREIYRNTVAGLEHTWKRISNTWDSVETNVVWDPTGYRVLGYLDGQPHDVALYTTPDSNVRYYNGFSLSIEGRPTPRWYFLAFYTLSWLWGTVETELNSVSASGIIPNNLHRIPQQFKFWRGYLPEDNRHQVHLAASYNLHGLTIGTRLEYASGSPRSKFFQVPGIPDSSKNIGLRSPRGTDPGTCAGSVPGQGNFIPATTVCDNNTGLIAEFRNPARLQIDLHVEYDFYPILRQHIAVTSDVFNVFNDRTPTTIQETDANSGTFGLVTGRSTALNLRLGARYDF
jgi:hypothetical protein